MRKLILTLLLAGTAATPALAQDTSGGRRDRGSQSTSSDDGERVRPARVRAERSERSERVRVLRDVTPAVAATTEAPRRRRMVRPADNVVQQTQTQTQVRRVRRGDDSIAGRMIEVRRSQREGTVEVHRDRTPTRDRDQTSRHRDSDRKWSNHWRSDRRYDWRRYRDHNRSIFRFGRYYDPYGYGYRRFSIGFSLFPSYYQSNYWLNDPWMYRLPPVYGPYRWVRYYDDALLVNIYTGQVVDVVHSFFW